MKSNTCDLTKQGGGLSCILLEVEKSAVYNELNQKQTLQLRLLAEELVGMLPELLKNYEGRFWLESEAQEFKLHVALSAPEIDFAQHQNLLAVSTSGKNAADTGIMGKIRAAAESLLLYAGYDLFHLRILRLYVDAGTVQKAGSAGKERGRLGRAGKIHRCQTGGRRTGGHQGQAGGYHRSKSLCIRARVKIPRRRAARLPLPLALPADRPVSGQLPLLFAARVLFWSFLPPVYPQPAWSKAERPPRNRREGAFFA